MIKAISTKGMTREDWLEARRHAIGGSDAAAIIGLNDYSSPLKIWLDKTGRLEPEPENEAMRFGHDLEEYVARRFCEATGKKVRRRNAILYNDLYPFAHANVDREIIGENAILECKTTGRLTMRKFADGEYPLNYYVQTMHYLAVTGAEKAFIAVLVLQDGLKVFEVPRNDKEIKALMDAESAFWRYVLENREPPAVAADMDALDAEHPASNGSGVDLFGRADIMRRFLEIKSQIKELEGEADGIAATLKQELGDNEFGTDGDFIVSWKSQTRSSFDKKAFQAANPGISLEPFMKSSSSRVFTIRKSSSGR